MKKFLQNAASVVRPFLGRALMALAICTFLSVMTGNALADGDDITTTVASLAGYWTAIKAIAIAVVLFVLGRKLLKKV